MSICYKCGVWGVGCGVWGMTKRRCSHTCWPRCGGVMPVYKCGVWGVKGTGWMFCPPKAAHITYQSSFPCSPSPVPSP